MRLAPSRTPEPGSGDAPHDERPLRSRSISIGALAGLVGIGCCVYPVVLVLLGLSTAAAAVDLGNRLFDEWGWAFKSAGVILAATAIWIQRRRARACGIEARPRLWRSILAVAAVGVATYGALYGVTTLLGNAAADEDRRRGVRTSHRGSARSPCASSDADDSRTGGSIRLWASGG